MTQTVIGQASGSIGVAGDNDWFKVNVTAGTEYVFSIGTGSLGAANGTLALYDANGNVVSGVANGSQISFLAGSTGSYYVGIAGTNGATGSYNILESTATYDFTNNTSTTGVLTVGGTATGALTAPGQQDWFKVSLTAGTGYQFNITGALAAGQVAIYDANGNVVATGNDNDTLAGDSLFFVAGTSGTYYIGASDTQQGTGAFTVSATTGSFDVAGNASTSGTIAVGTAATGTISHVGQQEWYKITLTAGTEYVLSASGSGNLIASVKLYDANGNAVVAGYTGGTNGGATSFEPTTSGTYYVAAGGVASTTGAFSLSVTTATPDVFGNVNTTGTVTVGGTATGHIDNPGQSDWYKVTLAAGGHYALTAGGGTLSDTQVTLYDSTGKALVSGNGSAFYEPTAGGTYYVGASSAGSNSGTFTVGVTSATVDFLGNTSTTGAISVGGTASGTLSHAGQQDWFKVSLTAGTEYALSVSGALSDGTVALYDSTGKLVAGGDSGTTAFTPATGGTYYVGAASASSSSTGAFTVSIATAGDDFSGNTGTTGSFTTALGVTTAINEFKANSLPANSLIVDTAADVQANLDALAPLVASGKITGIDLGDSSTPTITISAGQLTSDAAVLQKIATGYNLSISGYSATLSQFIQGQGLRYLPGSGNPGSNQAIELTGTAAGTAPIALGSGFNAVVIDGAHSSSPGTAGAHNYTFNVEADGTVNLLDSNTGQSQSLTGVTYLVFDGGTKNADSSYQSIYFVGSAINGEVTSLYNAAFLRQPDLAGLEYYAGPISNGSLSLHQAALNFIASPEFQHDFPTAAAPSDHGGANDSAFINTLYQNVLNRAASAAEVSFYDGELSAGTVDRATLLIDFALSPENQQAVGGFLVNTSNGAYADPSDLLSASVVLGQASAGGTLNPDAISPTSIGSSITVNGITMAQDGSITLTSSAPAVVLDLTATHSTVTVQNNGADIIDGSSFSSTITLTGATNTTLGLGHGGQDTVNLLGGTNTTINNFSAGSGTTLNVTNTTDPSAVQVLDGTAAKVAGANLTFGAGTSYVVNIGTVTDTSAATAATAANKAYGAAGAANEFVTFLAKDAAGDTLVWFWGSTSGAANGTIPSASLAAGADTNGNHLVDAAELHLIATLVGVNPSALTANDLV